MDGTENQTSDQQQDQGAPAGTPPAADAKPAAPARPEWAPEKFWDAEKGEVRVEALAKGHRELESKLGRARQEYEAERVAKRPKDANAYALTAAKNAPRDLVILDKPPGADFKPEEGKRYFVAKADDPLVQLARKHAHQHGLDQDQFSALFTDFAELQFAQQQQQEKFIEDARAETMKALGEHADKRIAQVSQLVEKVAGMDAVKALDIAYLPAPAIEALEKILGAGSAAAFQPAAGGRGVAGLTKADVDALMAHPDYWKAGSPQQTQVTEWFKLQAQNGTKAA